VFTKGWKSREGMLPSEYRRRNMFVEFMEDALGVRIRDMIGVDNMLGGSDFPHSTGSSPASPKRTGARSPATTRRSFSAFGRTRTDVRASYPGRRRRH
jgi:hypothetical protein